MISLEYYFPLRIYMIVVKDSSLRFAALNFFR